MQSHQAAVFEVVDPQVAALRRPRELGRLAREGVPVLCAGTRIDACDGVRVRLIAAGDLGYPERPAAVGEPAEETVASRNRPRRLELQRPRVDPDDVVA
jgi:hypothetical protein